MFTVILATCDDELALAQALSALVPAATEGLVRDVIVVDGGSRDGTLTVADVAGCAVVTEAEGGIPAAVDLARADWLLFLSPSGVLAPDWPAEALGFVDRAVLSGKGRASAAVFRYGRIEPGIKARLAELAARMRSRLFMAPHAEQGLLLSRAFYRALGGYRGTGDVASADMARRIGRLRLTLLRTRAMVRAPHHAGGFAARMRRAAGLALLVLRLPAGIASRVSG